MTPPLHPMLWPMISLGWMSFAFRQRAHSRCVPAGPCGQHASDARVGSIPQCGQGAGALRALGGYLRRSADRQLQPRGQQQPGALLHGLQSGPWAVVLRGISDRFLRHTQHLGHLVRIKAVFKSILDLEAAKTLRDSSHGVLAAGLGACLPHRLPACRPLLISVLSGMRCASDTLHACRGSTRRRAMGRGCSCRRAPATPAFWMRARF